MEKIYDVLVVGELNVDLILDKMNTLPEIGKEIMAQKMALTLGSSSAIFASNISSLGAKTGFIGKIGDDKFGEIVIESLQKKKVDTSLIIIDKHLGTGATIVLNFDEDRANVTYPGAMNLLTIDDIKDDDLQKARHLHFSSYFLQPGMWNNLGIMFRKAKDFGLTTSFDMQWDPAETWKLDMEDVLPYVDVFLPNEKELMALAKKDNLQAAIDSISKYTNILVIKQGNKGSSVFYQNRLTHMAPYLNKEVVDAIGAGDSFNAGFIYRFIHGESIEECQRFGNLIGAISTTASGGTTAFENMDNIRNVAKQKFNVEISKQPDVTQ